MCVCVRTRARMSLHLCVYVRCVCARARVCITVIPPRRRVADNLWAFPPSFPVPVQDFSLNAFVTQEWNDSRLQFYGLISAEYLELDSKLIDKFWVPDLYFSNEKRANFHSVTVPNRMLHVYSNGTVIYKLR